MSHSREQSDPDTTVLIAEDDPVFRRLLSMAVDRLGVKVETACDGEEAYQRLQQGGITFLVLDHQIPRCTGIEVLERMEAGNSDKAELPPTILCTAKGYEIDGPALTKRLGLVAILHKPFSSTQLGKLIFQNLP